MLHAVAEALHVSASEDPQWEEMTQRDAERFVVAGGLWFESVVVTPAAAVAARVQSKFCFQYIRPWAKEPPVQVLRLREEVQRSLQPSSMRRASVPATTMALASPMQDSKRRRSLLMAIQSPFKATYSPSAATIAAPQLLTQSAFASPRCKTEVLTPSRSGAPVPSTQRAAAAQQQQQAQSPQPCILRTPEPVMTGKRKRVGVTISPPQALRALQATPVPQLSSSSRWSSPKPELLVLQRAAELEEEQQQPPLKTRRLSEAGEKISMASFLVSKLCAFFTSTSGAHNSVSIPSDDPTSGESGTESDKSEPPSASGGFDDCDLFGGNATLLADIQDVLEPVWSLLETTSSRLQRAAWGKARAFSSPFVHITTFGQQQQQSNAGAAPVSELSFAAFEFGDEDDNGGVWANSSSSSSSEGLDNALVVRTRRQCREMRQLGATWRLW